jgi:uncharacterized protein (DUF983 family)
MTVISKPVTWQPDRNRLSPSWTLPALTTMLLRGARGRCPACGEAKLFSGYLRQVEACPSCAAPLGQIRADDAPPYFTMLAVGHVVIPLMLLLERAQQPALWVHAAIWLPLTCVLTIGLLRPIKGATIGLMLRLDLRKSATDA